VRPAIRKTFVAINFGAHMSFRPDPSGARTIEQAIKDLVQLADQLGPTGPRGRNISRMIRDLREYEMERRTSPPARQD
jgi:hypothetical protein